MPSPFIPTPHVNVINSMPGCRSLYKDVFQPFMICIQVIKGYSRRLPRVMTTTVMPTTVMTTTVIPTRAVQSYVLRESDTRRSTCYQRNGLVFEIYEFCVLFIQLP